MPNTLKFGRGMRRIILIEGTWRFVDLVEQIEELIELNGLTGEVEIDDDQYNNTIKLYYESTQQWHDGKWMSYDEDEDRWE